MTTGRTLELVVAIAILVASVWLYRANRKADQGYGSQGAVLLLVIGVLVLIHALGLMHYRPSQSEIEAFRGQSQ